MKVSQLFEKLNTLFSVDEQEWYDNSGPQISFPDEEVTKLYVSLDATPGSVDRAIEAGANVLLTHHPLFFGSGMFLYPAEPNGRAATRAVKEKLSIFSGHTGFDVVTLNEYVARLIGIQNASRLTEREGYIGDVVPQTLVQYADFVGKALNEPNVRAFGNSSAIVRRVAVINGSGGRDESIVRTAVEAGADVFVSSEFKHSVIRYALDLGCAVIDVTHFASELPFVQLATDIIKNNCGICVAADAETGLLNG